VQQQLCLLRHLLPLGGLARLGRSSALRLGRLKLGLLRRRLQPSLLSRLLLLPAGTRLVVGSE
tara:strand:+ start:160 stop:348 length:189 start_codon:yes stop_codon:yes gene_type:complete